ncbi:MAG: preprotein translocase subunit SecA [bacterium]|nr:preprotein translocase subunit SecA [bacterium]
MFKSLFDDGYKEYKRCWKIQKKVVALEAEMAAKTDEELRAKTDEFKERVKNGETLDHILPEAFAVVREAAKRVTGMFAFPVQIAGGIAIHGGNIAEMKTGEGKTLTAVMPAYLNALSGEGVHIVTVNEYLAARETEGEIGQIYRFLGLTVGLNVHDMSQQEKRAAYNCDILYSTHAELGFDYLRDNMALYEKDTVQRPLNCAIIDEIDSVLIDEARTPLIISGGEKQGANLYVMADRFAKALKDEDYEIDVEANSVALTEAGMVKAERMFNIENLYDLKNVSLVHHINNALKANYTMTRNKEYVVDESGEVLIVDPFTGRVMKGRQWSEGLHQAVEAKEGVKVNQETITLATITYQNFFRMYKKLCGMTGTAKTEEEEFLSIYNMYVVEVPTNRPVIRQDMPDILYLTMEQKYEALVKEVKERHEKGQPILIGTIAVETSEIISDLLTKAGIPHNVLNAKQHAKEADIVALAGQMGAVTIATNMAGRGTDIKLGEGVKELGGLAVIGTERHESRRIDNQLRGRSGRQGDPGYSRFYLSCDDELLIRFGGDVFKKRVQTMINLQNNGDGSLQSKMFSRLVEGAQKRIEGSNFDARKSTLKYDDIMRKQREIIYEERHSILVKDTIEEEAKAMMQKACNIVIDRHITSDGKNTIIDDEAIANDLNNSIFLPNTFTKEEIEQLNQEDIYKVAYEKALAELESKKQLLDEQNYQEMIKAFVLRVVDTYWTKHIDDMQALRQSVTLESYAQKDPYKTYQEDGIEMFERLNENINIDVCKYLVRSKVREEVVREAAIKPTGSNQALDESRGNKPTEKLVKVGRNDLCPCGSGKKYKFCCMGKDNR